MPEFILSGGERVLYDEEDSELISAHKWHKRLHAPGLYYAATRINGQRFFLHRLIANAPEGSEVDHADGNPMNNTRKNLRICTRSQNQQNRGKFKNNRSGYKGVYRDSGNRKAAWRAQITVNGDRKRLGYFSDPENAARAYDAAARKYCGEFANLNFPDS